MAAKLNTSQEKQNVIWKSENTLLTTAVKIVFIYMCVYLPHTAG